MDINTLPELEIVSDEEEIDNSQTLKDALKKPSFSKLSTETLKRLIGEEKVSKSARKSVQEGSVSIQENRTETAEWENNINIEKINETIVENEQKLNRKEKRDFASDPENGDKKQVKQLAKKLKKVGGEENEQTEKSKETRNEKEVPDIFDMPGVKKVTREILEDYNVMLNLSDITYGEKGHNKFYQIQIFHKNNREFTFYTKWGRVGAKNPEVKTITYESKYDAIIAFKKKFSDKTSNQWEKRANFKTIPGKYTMLQMETKGDQKGGVSSQDIERLNRRNKLLKSKIEKLESKLEPAVFDLMKVVWDLDRMTKSLKDLNIDTEKYPLGKLSAEQINKGYRILTEIQNLLISGAKESLLIELANQFYTNIPQNYGMRKLPSIDNIPAVKEKVRLLDILRELDVASKYINICNLERESDDINPLDIFYRYLKIKINPLTAEDEAFILISQMVQATHGPTHNKWSLKVEKIFSIERRNEGLRYSPFQALTNRALLWHGSRSANYVGIFSEGLKIAPPDAPATGYMFGKGIYFTEVVSKAANYCHASPENPYGIMLLSEVALGNCYQVYKAKSFKKPPKFYHSVHGVGRMRANPRGRKLIGDGIVCHAGEIIENEELINNNIESDLVYNEYIIYDVGQVNIKYVVYLKFSYKI